MGTAHQQVPIFGDRWEVPTLGTMDNFMDLASASFEFENQLKNARRNLGASFGVEIL